MGSNGFKHKGFQILKLSVGLVWCSAFFIKSPQESHKYPLYKKRNYTVTRKALPRARGRAVGTNAQALAQDSQRPQGPAS